MADLFAQANEAFVNELYEEAAGLYDQAIKQEPTNASFFLGRAANSQKLKNYAAMVSDAEAALRLSPNSHVAYLRQGTGLFYLDRFAEAKAALDKATELGNPHASLLIKKCQAELELQGQSQPAAAPSSSSSALSSSEPSEPQPPAASKVRESWYQSPQTVNVTLFAKNLSDNDVKIAFEPTKLSARLSMPDGSEYKKEWKLFSSIVVDGAKFEVNKFKVSIALPKAAAGDWDSLEEKPITVVKRQNIHDGRVAAYPSSKNPNIDWSEIDQKVVKEEEEEKPTGDQALQKMFQSIYASADEDTRRAMIKSYQTSCGTVLSTNWKEVADTDYSKNITPPKGQEVVKKI